jgi:peptidoglycan/xylan/chitin deacetylase (PgdA/CDA1 family)
MGLTRRGLLSSAGAFAGGAATVAMTEAAVTVWENRYPLPLSGGYAPTTHKDRRTAPGHTHSTVRWAVDTTRKAAALTFDDGPMPNWSPRVLDILEEHEAPATFFLVGERVVEHGHLLRGRMDRHEVANHSWDHRDFARRSYEGIMRDLVRAHSAIVTATGKEPTLLRPPYGHLGGTTLLAAAEMGYDVALWSVQMLESQFRDNPPGLVDYIVNATRPGSIILAHDTGPQDRLVAIDGLADMITGLRRNGYELLTVTDLVHAGAPTVGAPAERDIGRPSPLVYAAPPTPPR